MLKKVPIRPAGICAKQPPPCWQRHQAVAKFEQPRAVAVPRYRTLGVSSAPLAVRSRVLPSCIIRWHRKYLHMEKRGCLYMSCRNPPAIAMTTAQQQSRDITTPGSPAKLRCLRHHLPLSLRPFPNLSWKPAVRSCSGFIISAYEHL